MSTPPADVVFLEPQVSTEAPAPKKRSARLSPEEKAERAEARRIERERVRQEKAEARALAKAEAYRLKIEELEGPTVTLPAVVLRDGTVFSVDRGDIKRLLLPYMGGL